jgi:hypothetical protein
MAWQYILPIALEAGKTAYNYFSNKPKPFRDTVYAQRLKRLKERGAISPTMQAEAVSRTARTAGTQAGQAKAEYAGLMQARGLGRSSAALSGLKDIQTQKVGAVTDTAKEMAMQNELTKAQAESEYENQRAAYTDQYNQMKQQRSQQLVEGLASTAGAVANYVGYKQGQKAIAQAGNLQTPEGQQKFLSTYPGGFEEGSKILERLGRTQYYLNRGKMSYDKAIEFIANLEDDEQQPAIEALLAAGIFDSAWFEGKQKPRRNYAYRTYKQLLELEAPQDLRNEYGSRRSIPLQ